MTSTELVQQPVALDRPSTAAEIRAQVNLIQEVMTAVMKKDVHYGTIPGTPKPTLYKAGAEKILSTFHIAIEPIVTDLSIPGEEARFRVETRATSQHSQAYLGSGIGEASSHEAKYKWRAAVCDEEFNETPEDRRRAVWKKGERTAYQVKQVRTEPADLANTILKMAKKRSQIDATLTVTAASDVFAQDIEDLPDEVREAVAAEDTPDQRRPPVQPPQRKSTGAAESKPRATGAPVREPGEDDIPFDGEAPAPKGGGQAISDAQGRRLYGIAMGAGFSKDTYRQWLKTAFSVGSDRDIPASQYEAVVEAARKGPGR